MRLLFCCGCGCRGPQVEDPIADKQKEAQDAQRRDAFNKSNIKHIVAGSLSLVLGCLSLIWTPYEIMKVESLEMKPGLPPYQLWLRPDAGVLMKIHVFNVTNYEAIMNGSETTLRLQEVGPITYLEHEDHTNVRRNKNGTMTYVTNRQLEYLPEVNHVNLNDSVYVPNLAFLGMTSYLSEWPFFVKLGFNLLTKRFNPEPFVKMRIYDLLWNNTDPMLEMTYKLVPSFLPVNNIGYLSMIYKNFSDESTVFIGTKHPRKYFTMDQYRGRSRFGMWANETCDSVKRATEGTLYHQNIQKTDALHFFRKTVCKVTPILFTDEVVKSGIRAYNFSLPLDIHHRPKNGTYDCYTLPGKKRLPNGISDVARCFYDFPITESLPHFLGVEPAAFRNLEGQTPDVTRHGSYATVEPATGVPLASVARMQSNLYVQDVSSFHKAAPFSNMFIPLFWIELNQQDVPLIMKILLYNMVVITPAIQGFVSTGMIILGVALIYFKGLRPKKTRKQDYFYSSLDLTSNKQPEVPNNNNTQTVLLSSHLRDSDVYKPERLTSL